MEKVLKLAWLGLNPLFDPLIKAIGGSGVIFASEAYLKVLNPAEWPLFTELR